MRTPEAARRRAATERRGRRAEWLALGALVLKGYRPLAMRVSASGGEIDLIVRRGRTIAFVEVKARATLVEAQEAIGTIKRQRFSRAVRSWVARNPFAVQLTLRADAVFIGGRGWPVHLVDAFPLEGL